jgi:hypothetical protein
VRWCGGSTSSEEEKVRRQASEGRDVAVKILAVEILEEKEVRIILDF